MALVKCKECGAQVSSSAKSCPSCGAPPPKSTGRGGPIFVVGLALFVVVSLVARSYESETPPPLPLSASAHPQLSPSEREAQYQAARDARQKTLNEECTSGITQVMKTAKEQSSSGDLNMAAATLNHCSEISKDPSFTKLSKEIEQARTAKIARLEREEKARKKKEGVRIGMSKDDVIASSWGKPRKINKTTNARGTREQWVYDGGYLYFDGDTLTTVQN
ncbi:MAG TPA: zinc-ribbon domain-containing protein [Variovorax sp.]|nr:zinc-ribbon domain-containing protein [Variovorax sp.]